MALELQPAGAPRTAHQLVRDALRRAIVTGELPAGTRLVQSEVAERLRVSTTPVREAMRDLAAEGLVHLRAHRGATVARLDLDDLREICALRGLLEAEALRRAALRITQEELDTAREMQQRLEAERDPEAWSRHHSEFHAFLTATARSPRLQALVEQLRASAGPYVAAALRTAATPPADHDHQHLLIVRTLEARAPDAAAHVAASHVAATLTSFERIADAQAA